MGAREDWQDDWSYGMGQETKDDQVEDKEIRQNLYLNMLQSENPNEVPEMEMYDDDHVIASVRTVTSPLTWQEVERESKKDLTILNAIRYIKDGAIPALKDIEPDLENLLRVRKDLDIEGDIITFRGRPVVPRSLQKKALDLLHAAHQGTSKMVSRAEASIFWPGISLDIKTRREKCRSCDTYTPSQAKLPPVEPITPMYPFQHISADHLSFAGNTFGIIVDRFSNWIKIYEGKGGAHTFISVLRQLIEDFNIPESITTDGGPHYTAEASKNFFRQYGIHHRLTSVGNPHANTRAELGVKSAKRMLRENIGPNGKLNTVRMSQAIMTHRNTPDETTGLSPAELMLGRPLRDFLPSKSMWNPLKSNKDLANHWKEVAEWREKALAKRSSRDQERWSFGTKDLPPIPLGKHVLIQNQLGNQPKRWEKRGVVVEALPHQQYKICVDGSRRITLRNRRFLKPFTPLFQETSPPFSYTPDRTPVERPTPPVQMNQHLVPPAQLNQPDIPLQPIQPQQQDNIPHDQLQANVPQDQHQENFHHDQHPVQPQENFQNQEQQQLQEGMNQGRRNLLLERLDPFNTPGLSEGERIIHERLRRRELID